MDYSIKCIIYNSFVVLFESFSKFLFLFFILLFFYSYSSYSYHSYYILIIIIPPFGLYLLYSICQKHGALYLEASFYTPVYDMPLFDSILMTQIQQAIAIRNRLSEIEWDNLLFLSVDDNDDDNDDKADGHDDGHNNNNNDDDDGMDGGGSITHRPVTKYR